MTVQSTLGKTKADSFQPDYLKPTSLSAGDIASLRVFLHLIPLQDWGLSTLSGHSKGDTLKLWCRKNMVLAAAATWQRYGICPSAPQVSGIMRAKSESYSCQKGFTLTELLVVLAILGLLMGIAVGFLTGYLGKDVNEAREFELDCVYTAVTATMLAQDPPLASIGTENDAHDAEAERTNDMTAGGLLVNFEVAEFLSDDTTEYYYWTDDNGTVYQSAQAP